MEGRIEKLRFLESAGFNDQYSKAYSTNINHNTMDRLDQLDFSPNLSIREMTNATSDIMSFAGSTRPVGIDNGWGTQRINFAMVISSRVYENKKDFYYITGYTDSADYEVMGNIVNFNPRMRMYINSITKVRSTYHEFRGSQVFEPNVLNNTQVCRSKSRPDHFIRPVDVYRINSTESIMNELNNRFSGSNFRSGGLEPIRSDSKAKPTTFNFRENNLPSAYLHKTVKGYMNHMSQEAVDDPFNNSFSSSGRKSYHNDLQFGGSDDEIAMFNETYRNLNEDLPNNDSIISILNTYTSFASRGYITYEELLSIDPDFDEHRDLPLRQLNREDHYHYLDTKSLKADTLESLSANLIAQALPTLMINSMYSRVEDLIINTFARFGEEKVILGIPYPFMDGIDVTGTLNYFLSTIEEIVLKDVTKNSQFDVEARITADLDDVTRIEIAVDDGPIEEFVFPCFMDSLLIPTYTDNIMERDSISRDLVDVSKRFQHLSEVRYNTHGSLSRVESNMVRGDW